MNAEIFNLFEAVLWIGIGLAFLWRGHRAPFLLFLLFGLSDIVEMKTGAWWSPWWLLAWKAACVIGLSVLGYRHRRIW